MRNFTADMERARQFYLKNRGAIESQFSESSKLFNVEFDNSEIAKLIDCYCGIDYLLQSRGKIYGVAARINFNPYHHGHVTIRYQRKSGAKTEFEKRCESILNDNSEIYASITMQIDAVGEGVGRMIVFESDKLYMEIFGNLSHYENHHMRVNQTDGNTFFRFSHEKVQEISREAGFRVMARDCLEKKAA